jgi:hypothetical protein
VSDRPVLQIDHLVIAAATLAEGVAWCEATLGHRPEAGGKHPLTGTHNRIFGIGTARFPQAYGEIIAIDPDAAAPLRPRWFDLDAPALRRAVAAEPRLIHWVARCVNIEAAAASLRDAGFDPGEVVQAERETAHGLLRWRITVPADGRRPGDGTLPTLIEWGDVHPSANLAWSGVALTGVTLRGMPDPVGAWLGAAAAVDRSATLSVPFRVVLDTPRGRVALDALRLET